MKRFGKSLFFPKYGNSLYEATNYYPKPVSIFRHKMTPDANEKCENVPYKSEKRSETKCSKNSDGLPVS